MSRRVITNITVHEDGRESHESWLSIRANRVQAHPGRHLFDSEIAHQHFVEVTISQCTRTRDLNHDHLHAGVVIAEIDMSMAQWGMFVSSFGDGRGVAATLNWLDGPVPQAPHDPRLGESVREVRESGDRALGDIQGAYAEVEEAFERGAGKREMRELMRTLKARVENGPKNMEFAAKTLVEHSENVVTKARADIEAMIAMASNETPALTDGQMPQLGPAQES